MANPFLTTSPAVATALLDAKKVGVDDHVLSLSMIAAHCHDHCHDQASYLLNDPFLDLKLQSETPPLRK